MGSRKGLGANVAKTSNRNVALFLLNPSLFVCFFQSRKLSDSLPLTVKTLIIFSFFYFTLPVLLAHRPPLPALSFQ